MTLDEVTQAMEQQTPVIAKLRDADCPCFITGVISQYDKSKGWHYSLELQDRKARCVYRVALKDVEVDRNA